MQQAKAPPHEPTSNPPSEEPVHPSQAPAREAGLLTTGDMARMSGNTVRTVRFYEETGVLEPAHRSEGGHRLFPASELDKLTFVTAMRNAGLSLEEIKLLLGMKNAQESGAEASRKVGEVLERHIAAMAEKISVLSRVRAEFQQAARVLDGCRECHNEERFPSHCGGCTALHHQGPVLPLAVRVLWKTGQAAPAAAGEAPAAPVDEPG